MKNVPNEAPANPAAAALSSWLRLILFILAPAPFRPVIGRYRKCRLDPDAVNATSNTCRMRSAMHTTRSVAAHLQIEIDQQELHFEKLRDASCSVAAPKTVPYNGESKLGCDAHQVQLRQLSREVYPTLALNGPNAAI